MRTAIYVRVSTSEQSTEMQKHEILNYCNKRGWDIVKIYEDQKTGTNTKRPSLKEMMKDARSRKFDNVVVFKMDRLARSLKDLVMILQDLNELNITFFSLRDSIDLTTSTGRLMFNIIGAFSQFEADIIKERVKAGLENAKAKGTKLGRPSVLTEEKLDEIKSLRALGTSLRKISKEVGVGLGTVQKALEL